MEAHNGAVVVPVQINASTQQLIAIFDEVARPVELLPCPLLPAHT